MRISDWSSDVCSSDLCVEFLLAARDVALALGKYFERERDARAVGRELVVVDVERQIADRLGFAAAHVELPQLVAAAAHGQEVQRLAIAGPACATAGRLAAGQRPRGLRCQIEQPDLRDEIGRA